MAVCAVAASASGVVVARAVAGTSSASSYSQPAWSPDGRRLAFIAWNAGGHTDLGVMEVIRRTMRRIHLRFAVQHPSWGPGSVRVVLERSSSRGPDLWSVDVRDGGTRRVARNGSWPAWSARNEIAFSSGPTETSASAIQLVKPGGGDRRVLVRPTGEESYTAPSWTRTGDRVAFIVGRAPDSGNVGPFLAAVGQRGGRPRYLLRSHNPATASWAPSGEALAFTEYEHSFYGKTWVSVVDVRTGRVRRLHSGKEPAWSPTHDAIAFVERGAIYEMRSDGTHVRKLTP